MATVTGLTADRMLAIEAASIIDGDVVGDNLLLTKHDGSQINAGNVRGAAGPPGPISSDLSLGAGRSVLEVGLPQQIRAGRALLPVDFTNVGLSVPLGLWNLSDLSDISGNGRALLNKGAVQFAPGVSGLPNTAAKFTGSTAQALYIPDTGAADPFRIKTGSFGCWFRISNRGANQTLISKTGTAAGNYGWQIFVGGGGKTVYAQTVIDGTNPIQLPGLSDVMDDRWHFAVVTVDAANVYLYVDSVLESSQASNGVMFGSSAPLNIGAASGDAATASGGPLYGRVDEAFVTSDILSANQVRNLYCARISHTLGLVPTRVTLNVRRLRRGSAFVPADFATPPLRLYNFSAGSLGDEGSNNAPLSNPNGAVSVAGPDGSAGNAFNFNGAQSLTATDAGLPSGLNPRSYGCWVKTLTNPTTLNIMAWGQTPGTNDARVYVTSGLIVSNEGTDGIIGPFVADGAWHHVVITMDNAAADGVKRKLYLDGRLVAGSTGAMVAVTLGGATFFRVGAGSAGIAPLVGQIDGVFVLGYALTTDEILKLYTKGSQALPPSPKNPGDHVEALSSTDLLVAFDTLPDGAQVDLGVAA